MPDFAIIVTKDDCPSCEKAKASLFRRGIVIQEIHHDEAMQRSDRDDYMAALADNGMAFPVIKLPFAEWTGWQG